MVANIVLYKIGQVSLLFTHPNTQRTKKNIFFPCLARNIEIPCLYIILRSRFQGRDRFTEKQAVLTKQPTVTLEILKAY